MSKNYWFHSHSGISWQEFHGRGRAQVTGFPNSRWKTVEQMQIGDYLLCYQAGMSCWIGLLEVTSSPFYVNDEPLLEKDRIWHDVEFRSRVPVKVLISLTPETGVSLFQLKDQLSIFKGANPNSYKGRLRDNPSKWKEIDAEVIMNALQGRYKSEIEKNVAQDITALEVEEGEEIVITGLEGGKKLVYTNQYERDGTLRVEAIRIHGTTCKGCGFDFGVVYGSRGRNYIEVHHLRPLSSLTEMTLINPKEDMTVLCSNCHRMVHRYPHDILTLEQLQALIQSMKL